MKFTSTIIVNTLFIVGMSLKTTAPRLPQPFPITDNCWTPDPPACFAARPDHWLGRKDYIPADGNVEVGPAQAPPHLRIVLASSFTNEFQITNSLTTPHVVILFDHVRLRWLELQLRAPEGRGGKMSAPRPHLITASRVTIYTEEGLET
jgi:hypothetical protein